MMNRKRVFWATTALFSGLLAAGAASAQSSGTAAFEATKLDDIVVQGRRGPLTLDGAIVAENASKSRASITEEYIQTQPAGQSILNSINLIPGVNFTNNDAYGSAGGDLTIRGFDAARVSLTADGIPLNDTGNYAIYSNQQLDPELIERANVNLGTTDVDSPTASATGGTVNYITRRTRDEFGIIAQPSIGEEEYRRLFLMMDTGAFGPWGTEAWLAYSSTDYNHFKDPGGIKKTQYNGRLYQSLGDNGDFLALTGHYNRNRNSFTRRVSLADFNAGNAFNVVNSVDSSYTSINPSNTGNIRGSSRFTLSDQLTLTIDPSFQYVLANGGGTSNWRETDLQLRGNSGAAGVDLNGDGDILDTVTLYRPNTTNTHRYGVTSSLVWRPNEDNTFRLAYTYDYGRHRQTGEVGYIQPGGRPENPFAGRDGTPVSLPDGTILRRRDRLSYAELNQISAEYRGSFMADTISISLGLRAPFFSRELNNYCYQRDTFNAYCTTQTPTVTNPDGTVQFPASALNSSASNRYGRPRSFDKKYEAVLPNAGATWRFAENQSLYASYAEGFSAPRTDDLYDRFDVNPAPETTNSYDLGYRYQTAGLIASFALWHTDYTNRIVRTFDEAAGIFLTRNVGDVMLQGFDGQVGFSPFENFSLYGSVSYTDSEVKDDLPDGVILGVPQFIATAGKELVETPKWQYALRADYSVGNWDMGLQGKYVGERFATDDNLEVAPSYTVWDLDMRYTFTAIGAPNWWVQLNVTNLFDEAYLGDISTRTTGNASYQLGAPRTAMMTLRTAF
ncbi:TonB-dependent receptor [uncultured Brevundimonas sp.]|uniref:TonB-dependent receptor n=1 Tax=uncultured Brevundimonas sp. TaxID=213418 RepID=UPI0030EB27E9